MPLHPRVKAFAGRVWRDFPAIYKEDKFVDDGPDDLQSGAGIIPTLADHIRIRYYTAGCRPPATPLLAGGTQFTEYLTALAGLELITDLEKRKNLSAPLWAGQFMANPVVDDDLANDQYYLHNGSENPRRRYYIHAQPRYVPAVMEKVKSLLGDHPSTNAKCMGPAQAHRDDCIIVYATEGVDDAAIKRIITDPRWLRTVNMDAVVDVGPGISRGPGIMESWGETLSTAVATAFATDIMERGGRIVGCDKVHEFLTANFIRDNEQSFYAAVAMRLDEEMVNPVTLEAKPRRAETPVDDEGAPKGKEPRALGRKVARVLPFGHQKKGKERPAAQPRIKHSAADPPPVPSRSTKPPLAATNRPPVPSRSTKPPLAATNRPPVPSRSTKPPLAATNRPPVPSRSTKPPLTTASSSATTASSSASDRVRTHVAGGPPTAGFDLPAPQAPPRGGVPTPLAQMPVRSAGPVSSATSGRDPAASSSVGPTGGSRQRTHNPLIHELHEHSAFRAKQKKEGT